MRSCCPSSRSKRNANPGSLVQNAHSCSTVSIIWEVIFEETLVAPGVTEPLQTELTFLREGRVAGAAYNGYHCSTTTTTAARGLEIGCW